MAAAQATAQTMAGTYRIHALHEDLAGFDPHPSGINQKWHNTFWSE